MKESIVSSDSLQFSFSLPRDGSTSEVNHNICIVSLRLFAVDIKVLCLSSVQSSILDTYVNFQRLRKALLLVT